MKNLTNIQTTSSNPIVFEPQFIEEAPNIQPITEEPVEYSNN